MKRSGQGFFALPRRDYRHERMALLIRSMPEDRPVGSWGLVRILLHGREESLTVKQAKHLCERMIASAERNGFIRRLPVKAASKAPIPDERLGLQRELQFVATEYGIIYLRGKSPAERAKLLISIAHPEDREELEKAACKRFGYSFLRLH
jgi:hypothetical protein